jgi:uncharacterized membrane protein
MRAGGGQWLSTKTSITIDAPLEEVYNQWTQFEELPRIMEGFKEVHATFRLVDALSAFARLDPRTATKH